MELDEKFSIPVRIICGFFGIGGIIALILDFIITESIGMNFVLKVVFILLACVVFLYVAILGKNPLAILDRQKD